MAAERVEVAQAQVSTARIVLASLVGTTIEFYDFYIYGTAAALVIGGTFFPGGDPSLQALSAFLTFGIAFLARPIGSVLFGHFGDRIGRKSTLVGSMLVMGCATTLIGALPGYAQAGIAAPVLLCLLRLFQGIGLGGEWGGAALLAVENAPRKQRAWFGMFPQLGPPIGFLLANGFFLALLLGLGEERFLAFGWRIPFLASAVLVGVGLYVRVTLAETPAFVAAAERGDRARVPIMEVLRDHGVPLIQGSLAMVVCYALFYISTVFALSYGTGVKHIPRIDFLGLLCMAVMFMALATPISALLADMIGRRPVLLAGCAMAALSGLGLPRLLGSGDPFDALIFLSMELALMGFTFAPMGALLPELFPTRVRYTGASTAYNIGGILGASLAPSLAQLLLLRGGLPWVGDYVTVAALISFLAVLSMKETQSSAL
ncbi:MFS transporter [Lichenifustis flavocetrariae]|uniref:MHS family MFS transporter n=1 Tax=Lichenifustis flavocetrariae TaxID=2949735 RepID=A0AA41YYR3_9HYPH|nr:MFS transporter [Lichenifustis flavocetrariae]MCW6509761.1 MHS family MFS transporter [Lichenifustis flavocetrariae]